MPANRIDLPLHFDACTRVIEGGYPRVVKRRERKVIVRVKFRSTDLEKRNLRSFNQEQEFGNLEVSRTEIFFKEMRFYVI